MGGGSSGAGRLAAARKGIEFLEFWLNPNGNNNGTTLQTDLAIAALYVRAFRQEQPA